MPRNLCPERAQEMQAGPKAVLEKWREQAEKRQQEETTWDLFVHGGEGLRMAKTQSIVK